VKRYIFQSRPFIVTYLLRHIFAAAKDCVLNIRRTIIAYNILYQRFKSTVTSRYALSPYYGNANHLLSIVDLECKFFGLNRRICIKISVAIEKLISLAQKADMIKRIIAKTILDDYRRQKVIVLLGARQVGKTTLLSELRENKTKVLSLNCDNMDDVMLLEGKTSTELSHLLSPYELVFIDEAQRVRNIGLTLKMIGDLKLPTQVVVTGSSSLDMADEINEPATGRLIEHYLYPLSLTELAAVSSQREERRLLENRMIYGLYPEVVTEPADAKRTLMTLTNNYLYKDLFAYKGIKKPDVIHKLVRALALQLGNEVSYNELANLISIDKETVENYINLLEKCFVVFRLDSFSRNLRNEIKKGKKIYFYDNGVRNAVLSNFAPLELRNDVGALWENLMVSERVKRNAYSGSFAQLFFWRTHDQKEIDLIEDQDGVLSTFEFKWSTMKKARIPAVFSTTYPNSTYEVISPDNFWEFVQSAGRE
jgi:predicted AAA+ superfamily ATPase